MKVLNLFAGLGGNRFLWRDVKVVAVEMDPNIAEVYQELFPEDEVIVADARDFLLEHYHDSEFDFIWASPPCTTHSRARFWASKGGKYKPVYPDFSLYEIIVFLQHFRTKPWVVENTVAYYKPLIEPTVRIGRHWFWADFEITPLKVKGNDRILSARIKEILAAKGLPEEYLKALKKLRGRNKVKIVRDLVRPEIGKHILECARGGKIEN